MNYAGKKFETFEMNFSWNAYLRYINNKLGLILMKYFFFFFLNRFDRSSASM